MVRVAYTPPPMPPSRQTGQTKPIPLTHHEILGLVEAFSRSGRQVDLTASDRAARRLVF